MSTMQFTVGPVQYYWDRAELTAFYADVADSVATTVVLGEVVCARRKEMKAADWLALAHELRAAGKDVVLATQTLIETDADVRVLRRIAEGRDWLVEAGDATALAVLTAAGLPFVIGPHVNVYSAPALAEYARLGGTRWVAPVELPLADVAAIRSGAPALPVEVFAWGRMPLAFSARCFTARHHKLNKDDCEFRCRDDADGLLLSTSDGRPFLVLNGIQTQSAAAQCLIGAGPALRAAGVSRLRLSPNARGFMQVIETFDAVMNHGADARAALQALAALNPQGGLAAGFAAAHAGIEEATA